MNISDKLSNTLNQLKILSLKINPNPAEFIIRININSNILNKLSSRKGIDIDIKDVQIDPQTGIWTYKDKHVLLFIPDHAWHFDDTMNGLEEGRKYHLTDCQTINDMKQKKQVCTLPCY